jgi:hypothetical protein
MSTMSGIRIWARIFGTAAAASASGTATRTISHPAASSAQIWSTVAWTSRVSVLVMDCTGIGAFPPTGTFPTKICRVARRV